MGTNETLAESLDGLSTTNYRLNHACDAHQHFIRGVVVIDSPLTHKPRHHRTRARVRVCVCTTLHKSLCTQISAHILTLVPKTWGYVGMNPRDNSAQVAESGRLGRYCNQFIQ